MINDYYFGQSILYTHVPWYIRGFARYYQKKPTTKSGSFNRDRFHFGTPVTLPLPLIVGPVQY